MDHARTFWQRDDGLEVSLDERSLDKGQTEVKPVVLSLTFCRGRASSARRERRVGSSGIARYVRLIRRTRRSRSAVGSSGRFIVGRAIIPNPAQQLISASSLQPTRRSSPHRAQESAHPPNSCFGTRETAIHQFQLISASQFARSLNLTTRRSPGALHGRLARIAMHCQN